MAEHKTSREFMFFFETHPWESGGVDIQRLSKHHKKHDC
jgi:hypothetical protein